MILRIVISCFLIGFALENSVGQCSIKNTAFKNDEKLDYEIVYSWGIIWIPAGKITFTLKDGSFNGQPIYQIDATGSSYKGYDWFFKVRDYFRAYVDTATLKPIWALRNTSEGSYTAYENYNFDDKSNKVYMAIKTSKKPYHLDTLEMKGCIYDILTAAYHARNIDYSTLKPNEKFPLWTLIDGKVYPIYIRYIGKEVITGANKQKYSCIKLSSKMIEGTVFNANEELQIWITDDKNRIPILCEAKIIVGSVKALFLSAENLKNPFTSKLK